MRRNGLGAAFAFEQGLGLGLNLALPLAHLDWVYAELLRDLIDRLDSSHRLKAYLGFEFRQVCVALLRFIHGLPVSLHSVPLKLLSQIRGPLQIKQQNAQLSYLQSLGSTYITPKIYKDALLTVLPMTLLLVEKKLPEGTTCPVDRVKLLKMEVTQPLKDKAYLPVDAVYLKNAVLIKGNWQERWTLDVCGNTAAVPVDFSADGGGGAYFSINDKDIQPLKAIK